MGADHQKLGDHWYGIRPPVATQVAWGGRAILSKHGIDIPHDRQQWRGFSAAAQVHVDACLKELNRRILKSLPSGIISREHGFTLRGWECRYNTRASGGYLYIVIFPEGK